MSENYRTDIVESIKQYPSEIRWLSSLNSEDVENIITAASCILIHDSIDDKESKERLVALAKENDIPYCVFSNGFTATIFEQVSIREIKKDRMYNNFHALIEYFEEAKTIDLNLLSLGKNYEVEKAEIIQDRLVNGVLLNNRVNFNYERVFTGGSQGYKDLKELLYLSDHTENFEEFEDSLIQANVTAEILRQKILNMVKAVKQKYE